MNQTAANAIALAAATEAGQIEEYLTGLRSQRHTQDVEWAVEVYGAGCPSCQDMSWWNGRCAGCGLEAADLA